MNHPVLKKNIAERLLQRLDLIKILPQNLVILDDTFLSELLIKKYPKAKVTDCMPQEITAENESVDIVISNFSVHEYFEKALPEIAAILKPDGLFLFTLFGTDSLKEMRKPEVTFPDMHDIGDFLLKSGFKDPVVDMENLAFTYSDPDKIMPDMQGTDLAQLLGDYHGDALPSGDYPLTFEVIYGLAYKQNHEIRIPVDAITRKR